MRRVEELDGLRGVAISMVVAGHLATGIGPYPRPAFTGSDAYLHLADSAGVQLFFALSGYLITRGLLSEVDLSGSIALRSFWWRRLRRLYPPIIALCVAYLLVMVALPWTRGEDWSGHPWAGLGDIVMAMTYTTNFAWLFVPRSGWLGHTWSLAVEEQFYLLWPVVLLVAVRWRRQTAIAAVIAAGVGVTVVSRWLVPESVVERGLRWDALLLGALVAVTGVRTPRALTWIAVALLATLSLPALDANNVFYTASAAASALIVGGAHHLGWLRSRGLIHLGYLSYSLYLWHVFVMRFATPWWATLAISVIAAEVSYRLIERRFMANPPAMRQLTIDLRDRLPGRTTTPSATDVHQSGSGADGGAGGDETVEPHEHGGAPEQH